MTKKSEHNKTMSACRGQSLIEVIIAMAIFSLIAVSIVGLVLGGLALLTEGGRFSHADNLSREGLEAVRAILRNDWRKSVLSKSAVAINGYEWDFAGEDTSEQIGSYTRIINIYPIYRDENGEMVASGTPNSYYDISTKRIKARVEWQTRNGTSNYVENETLLANWMVSYFIQTDWSGGMSQTLWSDVTMYDLDDGQISAADSLLLKEMATSTYAVSGTLESSAYSIPVQSDYWTVEWREVIPESCVECAVRLQLKFAPDSGGVPGTWTSEWTGPDGDDGDEDDYYTIGTGELIPNDFSGFTWVKYKAVLEGNTVETPSLEEIRILYKR